MNMAYLSELIGRPVMDVDGEQVGVLKDLIANHPGKVAHPQVIAILVKNKKNVLAISIKDLAVLNPPAISLKKKISSVEEFHPTNDEIFLAEDILDKQIIDINGARVVRVNDLEITRVNDAYFVANVDVGGRGLIRRLGFGGPAHKLIDRNKPGVAGGKIAWDEVELLQRDQPIRLKVTGDKLSELHPADLAEILSDLNRAESSALLEGLDIQALADTLEEVEPEFQASLVEKMDNEKVADVLEEMAPDEAADLLAELPEDRSKELLNLMQDEEADDVRKLLTYPEDSAGGIMNTEFFTVKPDMTAMQIFSLFRANASEAETIYYVYVTDDENHLLGALSLRDLVLALPDTPVKDYMEDRVVTVDLLDTQDHTAQQISKYNLLAVPVVDQENHIHGIVTADDALDKIIPTAWKKRLPRMYH
jgi:magnesium transporter